MCAPGYPARLRLHVLSEPVCHKSLKRNSPDDAEMQKQMDWILKYCSENAKNEMWARTIQHWGKHLDETPTFWFLNEEIMAKARSQKIEDDN